MIMTSRCAGAGIIGATALVLAGTPAAAQEALGACDRATAAMAASCERNAPADFYLAVAICANIADAARRQGCVRQAGRDLQDAKATCREQKDARARVCRTLGQASHDPLIRPGDFTHEITNPYLPLKPGTAFIYRGQDSVVTVEVTRRTVTILGVTCVVVRDTAVVGGEVEEDTLDYFAQDRQGNVWYFGENTAEFQDGVAVSSEGSFIAGVGGAKPGIVMPARPRPGTAYRQEFALGEAEDLARVESLGEHVDVPYGAFRKTLKTLEFTPLEPGARENKYYAPGVGLVLAVNRETGEREELVRIRRQP